MAGPAVGPDLAAEHPGDVPADGQPEPGAAVPAAGGPVGLPERVEDEPELVFRDADAGVAAKAKWNARSSGLLLVANKSLSLKYLRIGAG